MGVGAVGDGCLGTVCVEDLASIEEEEVLAALDMIGENLPCGLSISDEPVGASGDYRDCLRTANGLDDFCVGDQHSGGHLLLLSGEKHVVFRPRAILAGVGDRNILPNLVTQDEDDRITTFALAKVDINNIAKKDGRITKKGGRRMKTAEGVAVCGGGRGDRVDGGVNVKKLADLFGGTSVGNGEVGGEGISSNRETKVKQMVRKWENTVGESTEGEGGTKGDRLEGGTINKRGAKGRKAARDGISQFLIRGEEAEKSKSVQMLKRPSLVISGGGKRKSLCLEDLRKQNNKRSKM